MYLSRESKLRRSSHTWPYGRDNQDKYTCLSTGPGRQSHRETRHSWTGVLPQGQDVATPAWTGAEF